MMGLSIPLISFTLSPKWFEVPYLMLQAWELRLRDRQNLVGIALVNRPKTQPLISIHLQQHLVAF